MLKEHLLWIIIFFLIVPQKNSAFAQDCVVKVNGTNIFTPDSQKVILRGVNAFTIFGRDEDGFPTFKNISETGANVSRIVWKAATNDGTRMNPAQLETLIKECIARKMLAMPELHDATGKDANSAEWQLVMDYWTSPDVKAIIKKYEKFILLNIANEVLPGKVTQAWEDLYKPAITILRNAGYKCPLVIDAPQWGRFVDAIVSNGNNLLQHDPEKNIIFSWHPWNSFTKKSEIKAGIDNVLAKNLCLIIGEFGQPGYYDKGDPDIPQYIMDYSQEKGTGWLSWEWYNKGEQHEHISNNPDNQCDVNGNCSEPTYTPFGRLVLFEHKSSISKTAVKVNDIYFSGLNCLHTFSFNTENQSPAIFRIYPNPAKNLIQIDATKLSLSELCCNIRDLNAKLISSEKVQSGSQFDVDISSLPMGIYFVEIRTSDGFFKTDKFVKY
jgi:mannan endo-1,4-beta-mannosidase